MKNLTLITTGLILLLVGSPKSYAAAGSMSVGFELYQRLSCKGCHAHEGHESEVTPSLDGVDCRLSREGLEVQLKTPRQLRNDSRMPSFAFVRPQELQKLLDFLQCPK